MTKHFTTSFLFAASVLLLSAGLSAHHGQGNAYDTSRMWTTWATVEEFVYANPHPSLKFARTDKNGKVEHWTSEMSNNPSRLARIGWTKSRSSAALTPGTRVKLYVATARSGGFSAFVQLVESEKGELLVSERDEPIPAEDLDGVPGGYQPK